MQSSLISVIITTFKRHPNIVKRAINSVINQTYKNLEIIIVDDSPKDYKLRDEVEEMISRTNDDRIKYIKHSQNLGACIARNTGIINSVGEFIAFLDDDDEWHQTKLEKQIKKMIESNCGLVYCKYITVNELQNKKNISNNKCYSGFVFDKLIVNNFIGSTSFVLLKKECLEECGLFDQQMQSAQDYELWLRVAKKYKVDYIDEPLVNYYIHDGERITTNPIKKIQGLEQINIYYSDYLDKHRKTKSIRLIKIFPYYLMVGNYKKAINNFFHAFILAPYNIPLFMKCLKYIINLRKLKSKIKPKLQ